jgi:transcriptional regulator with XRE-family HTH domain
MKLGEKISHLRSLEGFARGLGRELTQSEVSAGIRKELDGGVSQSYLSQIESGGRPHLTATTRALLARFFGVHPGYLVDDPEDAHLPIKPRRGVDERVDSWLIDAAGEFHDDPQLSRALLAIAKHDQSRECLVLLGSIVENRVLVERLVTRLTDRVPVQPRPRARKES